MGKVVGFNPAQTGVSEPFRPSHDPDQKILSMARDFYQILNADRSLISEIMSEFFRVHFQSKNSDSVFCMRALELRSVKGVLRYTRPCRCAQARP